MDLEKVSEGRREVLARIAQYEAEGRFDEDVENDPPAPVLMPGEADYLTKKLSSKIMRRVALRAGDKFFKKLIKQGILTVEEVRGREHLSALEKGAVITCNHFSAMDNYVVFNSIRKELGKKRFYRVIREGNYTNFPGLYGFLFKHCDTLPLSSNPRTMIDFLSAANTLLKRGEVVLIYPEQGMWWNYRKPRPVKPGGYKMAYRAGVPVIPCFITMRDSETLDGDNYPLQIFTLHILPPIYPDLTMKEKPAVAKMMEENYRLWKEVYEQTYGVPLVYAETPKDVPVVEVKDEER